MKYDAFDVVSLLKQSDPSIWVQEFSLQGGVILLNPVCLAEKEEELIVKSFRSIWKAWNLI